MKTRGYRKLEGRKSVVSNVVNFVTDLVKILKEISYLKVET